jgi:hypothetical protein
VFVEPRFDAFNGDKRSGAIPQIGDEIAVLGEPSPECNLTLPGVCQVSVYARQEVGSYCHEHTLAETIDGRK